jgi:hypothetical protein
MKINKFQFLISLFVLQLCASSGFTRERPERFAQDLGGNSVCSAANRADPHSRCPLRTTAAVLPVRATRAAPAAAANSIGTDIPAPFADSERTPSAIFK